LSVGFHGAAARVGHRSAVLRVVVLHHLVHHGARQSGKQRCAQLRKVDSIFKMFEILLPEKPLLNTERFPILICMLGVCEMLYSRKIILATSIFLWVGSSTAATKPMPEFCALVRDGQDGQTIVGPDYDQDDTWNTSQFDFDLDGKPDEMTMVCSQGAGFIPADPCDLTLKLTSGKTIHEIFPKIAIHVFKKQIYIVASYPFWSGDKRKTKLRIFKTNTEGLNPVCQFILAIDK
jgi:hypothetical protein